MTDETTPEQHDEGGMCADIDSMLDRPYAIAPSVDKRYNTIRQKFGPSACWRIDDHRFDFDSSFIMPTSSKEFALLAEKRPPGPPAPPGTGPYIHVVQSGEWLDGIAKHYGFASWRDLYNADENAAYRAKHPDPNKLYPGDEIVVPGKTGSDPAEPLEDPNGLRLTVFGHADPTGKDDYNQILAGRRAKAVYAVLVRDVEIWDDLYCQSFGGDEWAMRHNQLMLAAVGFDPGGADGKSGPKTTKATKSFQASKTLGQSGFFDPPTRKKLFRAYMDVLCVNAKGVPFQYNRKDFLSKGEGKDGKTDCQSCGESNPLVVFSKEKEADYKKPENKGLRDSDNTPNRRVTIYMFSPDLEFPPEKWPCPTIKEGNGKCKARFWIDGEKRRSPQAERRDSRKRGKTFACKWYERIAWRGACEGNSSITARPVVARLPTRFSNGRTFPKPSCIPVLREIVSRFRNNPGGKLLVMGHSDYAGSDDSVSYGISVARANAVAALLSHDSAFFRARFRTPDASRQWAWEEVQFMLSAVEAIGAPLYVGLPDECAGDLTVLALQSYQFQRDLEPTGLCAEETLQKLITDYLDLIDSEGIPAGAMVVVGGGCWHSPETADSFRATLAQTPTADYRRVELFLFDSVIHPSVGACSSVKHVLCRAYRQWWKTARERLESPQHKYFFRLRDVLLIPMAGVSAKIVRHEAGERIPVADIRTDEFGTGSFDGPQGYYSISCATPGGTYGTQFYAHSDETSGLSLIWPARANH